MPTPATRENMDKAPKGTVCISLTSPTEEYSASSGDYFTLPRKQVLCDSYGDPMILARRVCLFVDALTGEEL